MLQRALELVKVECFFSSSCLNRDLEQRLNAMHDSDSRCFREEGKEEEVAALAHRRESGRWGVLTEKSVFVLFLFFIFFF